MRSVVYLFLIVVLYSCAGKKALKSELPLFTLPNENNIWLINSVATQKNGNQRHVCALVVTENKDGKNRVNYYTTFLDVRDSAFVFGNSFSENAVISEIAAFPLNIRITNGDSVKAEQSVSIGRKKIRLATELKDETTQKGEAIKFKMNFRKRIRFLFSPLDSNYGIMSTVPVKSRLRMTGRIKKNTNDVFLTVISRSDDILKLKAGNALVWVDLMLDDNEHFCSLFEIEDGEKVILKAYKVMSATLPEIKVLPFEVVSSETNKSYSLKFILKIPGREGELEVRPRLVSQEVNVRRSSFWMGGVEVLDAKTKTRKGIGNMYNFSNKTFD